MYFKLKRPGWKHSNHCFECRSSASFTIVKMSYIVLARKYRPKNFLELKGQEILVQTLTNAINFEKLHHAYVLTGIRGIGKTTTARIIAKTVNCENVTKSENGIIPCEECSNCISIKNNSHPDVIEFDAASNTGIDEVKEMFDGISYAPALGKYRVFIVDEVHMLSTKAFNSLLKTLEEPPHNVLFVFATTEIQKVPITILSRCQKFALSALSQEKMEHHLHSVCEKESVAIEDGVLKLIAEKSGGSVRDALSILDQAIMQSNAKKIEIASVKLMLSFVSQEEIEHLFNELLSGNVQSVVKSLKVLKAKGLEEVAILEEFLEYIYTQVQHSIENGVEYANLLRLWNIFLHSVQDLQIATNKYIALEMVFVKAVHVYGSPSVENLLHSINDGKIAEIIKDFPNATIN